MAFSVIGTLRFQIRARTVLTKLSNLKDSIPRVLTQLAAGRIISLPICKRSDFGNGLESSSGFASSAT